MEIKITLEILYDILRNEKKKQDLQELSQTFYQDVADYVQEKEKILAGLNESSDIFSTGEKDKIQYELKSIRKIIREIYERREKKLIDIALNKSRTRSDLIDTNAMLPEERQFFESTQEVFDNYRIDILGNLSKGKIPELDEIKPRVEVNAYEESTESESDNGEFEGSVESEKDVNEETDLKEKSSSDTSEIQKETKDETRTEAESESGEESNVETQAENKVEPEKQEVMKIRFVNPMPSFIWKDMKEYGPFDIGEEAEIFPEVAELLIRKGRAEKV